jgi:hypothetical protein
MVHRLQKKAVVDRYRCRKCGISKTGDDFYRSCEMDMDLNGRMPICKVCCNEITNKFITVESSIERGIFKTCRKLNILYDKICIEKTIAKLDEMKENGKSTDMVLGTYLRLLFTIFSESSDLTFKELKEPIIVKETLQGSENSELEKRWGRGFSNADYTFLEEEYSDWSEDRKTLTAPDKTLLEEICHLKLQIKKTRSPDNPADDLVEKLQKLVKSANEQLKVNKDQEEEGLESISSIIKIMESQYPADFYKDRDLYKDYDYDLNQYHEKNVTRPIKNFASGTRDFDFDINSEKESEEDIVEVDPSLPQKEDDD